MSLALRNPSSTRPDEIVEKTFDVVLSENLFEMRKDTKLILVDVPGFDAISDSASAKKKSKFQDYFEKKWATFDCVVLS